MLKTVTEAAISTCIRLYGTMQKCKSVQESAGDAERTEDFGIERILTREEAANMGADENCFLMLEAKEGWFFLDEWEQLTAAEKTAHMA